MRYNFEKKKTQNILQIVKEYKTLSRQQNITEM